jgi:hypothetical protein
MVYRGSQPCDDVLPFPLYLIPNNPNDYTCLGVGVVSVFVNPTKVNELSEPVFRAGIFRAKIEQLRSPIKPITTNWWHNMCALNGQRSVLTSKILRRPLFVVFF